MHWSVKTGLVLIWKSTVTRQDPSSQQQVQEFEGWLQEAEQQCECDTDLLQNILRPVKVLLLWWQRSAGVAGVSSVGEEDKVEVGCSAPSSSCCCC